MPSPIHHCTTVAELQALVTRVVRVYPDLDERAVAAGGLIAANAVLPDPGYGTFRVGRPQDEPCRVDLYRDRCTCTDAVAPVAHGTRLCEHVIACLIVKHLAERAEALLSFRPFPPHGPAAAEGGCCSSSRQWLTRVVIGRACSLDYAPGEGAIWPAAAAPGPPL